MQRIFALITYNATYVLKKRLTESIENTTQRAGYITGVYW